MKLIVGPNAGTGDGINDGARLDVEPGIGIGNTPEVVDGMSVRTGGDPELDKEPSDGAGLRGGPSDCISK